MPNSYRSVGEELQQGDSLNRLTQDCAARAYGARVDQCNAASFPHHRYVSMSIHKKFCARIQSYARSVREFRPPVVVLSR